jgi:DNA-directed RNA polymerase subunit M/transcription elongation factor TFIIS
MQYETYKDAIPLTFDPFYSDGYNNTRRLKAIVLSSVLSRYSSFKSMSYDDQINLVIRIENSFLNETIRKSKKYNIRSIWDSQQFVNMYHTTAYNIISILEQDDNTLFQDIVDGSVNVDSVASLSCKELSPEKYKTITDLIARRVNTVNNVKYTEMYRCGKCKKNQCTTERKQLRSNDEACNFVITCLFCSNSWVV